ncbi:MAG: hypothetical protein KDA96_07835 [Planctomycetaceae bacterium]|nr:hypothetical protein [Planctomycetaceae bacterium]
MKVETHRWMHRQIVPASRTVVVCLLLTMAFTEQAAAQRTPSVASAAQINPGERFESFQSLLEERPNEDLQRPEWLGSPVRNRLRVVGSWNQVLYRPSDSVIVIIGELNGIPVRVWEALREYVTDGGSLFLASDSQAVPPFFATFHRSPVRSGIDVLDGDVECFRLSEITPDPLLTEDVQSVVVCGAGWLTLTSRHGLDWVPILRHPPYVQPRVARGQPVMAYATTSGTPGRSLPGFVALSASPKSFANRYILEADNAPLAIQLSEQLCQGTRSQLLFVVDGIPQSSYRLSPLLSSPPPPPTQSEMPDNLPEPDLETMIRIVNETIRNVEESNLLNETLMYQPRQFRTTSMVRAVLVTLALIVTAMIFWKLAQRIPWNPSAPVVRAMRSAFRLSATTPGIAEHQYADSARTLAREICTQITGSDSTTQWIAHLGDSGRTAPRTVNNPYRKQAVALLDLALHGTSPHISRRRFEELGSMMLQLRTLHQQDQLLIPAINTAKS